MLRTRRDFATRGLNRSLLQIIIIFLFEDDQVDQDVYVDKIYKDLADESRFARA